MSTVRVQPAVNSEVKEVDSFMYLDAIVTKDGGGTVDTKRISNGQCILQEARQHFEGC